MYVRYAVQNALPLKSQTPQHAINIGEESNEWHVSCALSYGKIKSLELNKERQIKERYPMLCTILAPPIKPSASPPNT